MKKITVLALHLGYGGIERCISSLVNSLDDDYKINIVSTYKLYDEPGFEISDKIKIEYLIEDLKPNKNDIKNAIREINIIKFIKEILKAKKILKLKKQLMINYIKRCDSDIIISTRDIHNKWLGKYGNNKSLKIGWEHNHHHGNMKYVKKITNSVKNLDYLVLVSKELTDFYQEKLKCSKCEAIYIPNSIDYYPLKKSNLDSKNIISIGRLSKEKGYVDLIDVFKLVDEIYGDIHLDIIGEGPEREKIETKIKKYQLQGKIKLHGFQKRDYINKLLEQASVYVMCSHTESFGIVLLEANSFGIPAVAFDSAEGANEIISDNWDGYLIKDRNKEKMAKRICELIANKNRRVIMGNNAQKKAHDYDIVNTKEKWKNLFEGKK